MRLEQFKKPTGLKEATMSYRMEPYCNFIIVPDAVDDGDDGGGWFLFPGVLLQPRPRVAG